MTKRLRDLSDNVGNVDITSMHKVFVPDVRVQYGTYKSEEDVNENNNLVEEVDEVSVVDDFDNDYNYDNDGGGNDEILFENEHSDDDQYEIPTFNNEVFDDSQLFSSGLLVSKPNSLVDLEDEVNRPLFEDSNFSLKEFCRYLLVLKTNLNLGDVSFTIIVGSILAFLPERNGFNKYININPSMYDINKTIEKLSNTKSCCRVFKFNVCDEGTCVIRTLPGEQSNISCNHKKTKKHSFLYLPIRDRILRLLQSDVRNLLHSLHFTRDPNLHSEVMTS